MKADQVGPGQGGHLCAGCKVHKHQEVAKVMKSSPCGIIGIQKGLLVEELSSSPSKLFVSS